MTSKLPRQSDLDSQILELSNPFGLILRLGCLASALSVIITWLALVGLMSAALLPWAAWPYIAAPIGVWIVILALPAMLKARRGALATLDAIATTAEAWLARAGYSIDLNSDGYIGHIQPVQIEPPQVETVTPAVWTSPQGTKLLATDAAAIPAMADLAAALDPPEPITRRVWNLPGDVKCPQETLENFVERIFVIGWGRDAWVGANKPLERPVYDGLLNLMSQAGIITDRKPGYAGKLAVDTAAEAKRVLGLLPRAQRETTPPPTDPGNLAAGNYEHI